MWRLALATALTIPLAGCGWIGNTFSFVGDSFGFGGGNANLPFRASASPGEDRRDLVVSVAVPTAVPLDDFRESARFPVTRYCLENFGTSEADWVTDPASVDWAVTRTTDGARLQARCTGRA